MRYLTKSAAPAADPAESKSNLIEIEPGRFVVERRRTPPARSDLPLPYVISDIMPATEQVDGRFYSSKSAFRAAGKQLGLIEVGTEKPKAKVRVTDMPETARTRRAALKTAVEKFKAGHRVRRQP